MPGTWNGRCGNGSDLRSSIKDRLTSCVPYRNSRDTARTHQTRRKGKRKVASGDFSFCPLFSVMGHCCGTYMSNVISSRLSQYRSLYKFKEAPWHAQKLVHLSRSSAFFFPYKARVGFIGATSGNNGQVRQWVPCQIMADSRPSELTVAVSWLARHFCNPC